MSHSEDPEGRKGWKLTIDVEAIAQAISRMKAGPWKAEGYEMQNQDARIASLRRTLESVLAHELLHVVQLALDPAAIDNANRRIIRTVQAVAGSGLALLATTQNPELSIPATLAWVAACTFYVGRTFAKEREGTSVRALEEQAYSAQHLAMDRGLIKNPFKITHEEGLGGKQPDQPIVTIRPF